MPRPDPSARRRRGLPWALPALVLLLVIAFQGVAAAQSDSYGRRFDTAWNLVENRYWDLGRTGVDWAAAYGEYRPRALAAPDDDAFYAVLEEMYALLNDHHSVFVPPDKVAEVRAMYGDLPCIMVLGDGAGGPPPDATYEQAGGFVGATAVGRAGTGPLEGGGRLANVTYDLLASGVGYVRLPDLATDGAAEAVRTSVTALQGAGAWSLVLDLRGNPGGRLVTMMQVAGVFTRGFLWRAITNWSLPVPYPAIGLSQTDLPLAVLIDRDVNSAAEGLAGALQLRGRAVVVGERSAGNVEALLPFCLRYGSQAWIATGVLAPIGGPTWEGRGVVPDVAVDPDEALSAAVDYLEQRRP